ncbi:hypothetical protein SOCE26_010190 [Sorangium cellulosum]|uniref:Glycosyltransferase RgtA/B/C/D-like domain-containing protein n=1 Tax=Sorangium cellulosum TaxID=56 RepID=A0A2L0EJZ5_SORCE|nr:hypothetical protein [Sorangium cellulosum]AUX39625.1 hypothetical protein SOCE26_010190 [Sorangium cellulosum]
MAEGDHGAVDPASQPGAAASPAPQPGAAASPAPDPDAAGTRSGAAAPSWNFPPLLRTLAARARPYVPALAASGVLGALCTRAVLADAGHPALPLDDAFIHMQYARRLAEGGFFSFVAGEGYSTGATSLLWPVLLAPFYALGLRDLSLVYAVWALGLVFHAALAVETARLARPLAGPAAAAGAGAMCVACAAFAWFAWSGMETVAFAWILTRTARLAAALCEPAAPEPARDHAAVPPDHAAALPHAASTSPDGAPPASARQASSAPASTYAATARALALSGLLAPLLRPEGALASLIAALALATAPRPAPAPFPAPPLPRTGRLLALVPLLGPLVVPALNLLLAGHATSSTTAVKWLIGNPNYDTRALRAAVLENLQLLVADVLNGGRWTAVFLPEGSGAVIALGAVALVVAAHRRGRPAHAAVVIALALGVLLPCTYLSFLWNRVRYVWPFAPAWIVMAACLAREIGDLAQRLQRSLHYVAPLVAGAFAGALAARLPWAIGDLANSARAIDRQQVWLGRWAAEHLPEDARIGVNDTGALAYFSGRRTFDVVGLTTEGEARYWVAGPGSRFEHYEKLPPDRRPTHFIVYPHWMACPPVLGRELVDATVEDQAILGGTTMVAYEARWELLGSGALPVHTAPGERILDELDVSDLESESAHDYRPGPLADQHNHVVALPAPESSAPGELDPARPEIADGGRFYRTADRFLTRAAGAAGVAEARLVLRVAAEGGAELAVSVAGQEVGTVEVPAGTWVERDLPLPAARLSGPTPIEITLRRGSGFHAFHYWITGR